MHRRPFRLQLRPVLGRFLPAALAAIAIGLSVSWYGLTAQRGDPASTDTARPAAPGGSATVPTGGAPRTEGRGSPPGQLPAAPGTPGPPAPTAAGIPSRSGERPAPAGGRGACALGAKLVPTCGVLWGAAPGAHTERRGAVALREYERKTGRTQTVFHAYHRGLHGLFPTKQEAALAREPGRPRVLFLNWKPASASWGEIARGHRATDAYLDRLARHIRTTYPERFFFTVHHEPEDDVRDKAGSGYTARDYAAMFRHVVQRLRARGVANLVTVVVHMAYVPLTSRSWFPQMYPGDDVVDWIGFDTYAYSEPGYGHGDFAELMNRRSAGRSHWPGFYNWATRRHPGKPLMVAEWGVWHSQRYPAHKARFYRSVAAQIGHFPRIKALVHFDTPGNQKGWDSRVDSTPDGLAAYRALGALPVFRVAVRR